MKKLMFSGLLVLCMLCTVSAQREVAYLETPMPELLNSPALTTAKEFQFELVNGLIVIQGELEDRYGYFILDTGAPGLVVNEETEADPTLQARSIGGEVAVGQRTVSRLRWGGIELTDIEGYSIDMGHLEQSIDRNLLGLLGFDLLDDYEILLDYRCRHIQLIPLESEIHKLHKQEALTTIPFEMEQHLPVIRLQIGRKKYDFGIDCGASINLIDQRFQNRLSREVDSECCLGYLRGLDGHGELSSIVTFRSVSAGDVSLSNTEFQWTAFEGLEENGLQIDGLVGSGFFGTDRISINYREKLIYIWP